MNDPKFSVLADKYQARLFVKKEVGEQYLIPLLFVTEDPDELRNFNWNTTSVIVKPNHGAGMYKIVNPPLSAAGVNDIVVACHRWVKTDFSHVQREIHYRYISPLILVEKLLGDGVVALIDYKFHLFKKKDGSFDYVLQVINDRFSGVLSRKFYVNNFESVFECAGSKEKDIALDLENLELALSLSKTLARDFNYVRVDWYIHFGQLYFGEITFTPVAGFGTGYGKALDHLMGELWIEWR
ncbi:ATP-grasp fold amidoligase family protein [Serratia marcescens]|uniref:ATP-grasp fold amidoligase family protein n=2 Tax=Serratia marcescens TaxID=615 RepID=UPI00235E3A91|nr:ATP-grasp fold amidoligase family protein [Serratia marcescens]